MDFLEQLKQDPNCLYIYNWGLYIYGLINKPDSYTIIVSDEGKNTTDEIFPDIGGIHSFKRDGIRYKFYRIKYWFDKILLGDIECGECSCLNKKYVIKEHVKLIMQMNPLNLRKEIDRLLSIEVSNLMSKNDLKQFYGRIIRHCKFANQIIDNHKIVNYKEANKDFYLLQEANDIEYCYKILLDVPYKNLKLKTDDILKRSKIEKILQKRKNG